MKFHCGAVRGWKKDDKTQKVWLNCVDRLKTITKLKKLEKSVRNEREKSST